MHVMFLEGLRNTTSTLRENRQWPGQDLTRVRVQSLTTAATYRIFSNLIRTSFCRFLKRKKKHTSRF
jgi:hypothetical protein